VTEDVTRNDTVHSLDRSVTMRQSPYRFTGGVIRQVRLNVSGEPYLDLELEAQAMPMRE
jgi:hypothetical protein